MVACLVEGAGVFEEVYAVNSEEQSSPPQPATHRQWSNQDLEEAYKLGVLDGNAGAVRVLLGCLAGLRVVEDRSLPEGTFELRVANIGDIVVPSRYLNLLMPE